MLRLSCVNSIQNRSSRLGFCDIHSSASNRSGAWEWCKHFLRAEFEKAKARATVELVNVDFKWEILEGLERKHMSGQMPDKFLRCQQSAFTRRYQSSRMHYIQLTA